MRSENELIMRNLRNVNQDLQAQVREVKSPFIVCRSGDDIKRFSDSSSCRSISRNMNG